MKPEDILRQEKYHSLKNLVLICEAMEEFADAKLDEAINITTDVTIYSDCVGLNILGLKTKKQC